MSKRILIIGILLAMLAGIRVVAKEYAYVYIEGDKETPFYVKVEGQMMPRYGKNYFILPNLDEGVMHVEILFQQNIYPAQHFAINVPPAGSRGFLLKKIADQKFGLYDLQQGSTLVAGNKATEDVYALPATSMKAIDATAAVALQKDDKPSDSDLPDFEPELKKPAKPTQQPREATSKSTASVKRKSESQKAITEEPETVSKPEDRFLSDIEFNPQNNEKGKTAKQNSKSKNKNDDLPALKEQELKNETTEQQAESSTNNAVAGNCSEPLSNQAFEQLALRVLDAVDDNARLKALKKNSKNVCFTTEQVRILANGMETQSARYDVAKDLYMQVYDKEQFPKLESLFKTNYLKAKFRELLP